MLIDHTGPSSRRSQPSERIPDSPECARHDPIAWLRRSKSRQPKGRSPPTQLVAKTRPRCVVCFDLPAANNA